MKIKPWILFAFLVISGCDQTSTPGEDCSIALSEVIFSKSLNGAKDGITSAHEKSLVISSKAKTDYFNEPDGKAKYGNAPVLLTEIRNNEPFTFSIKVTPEFSETYDAGAVYIFVNDEKWVKFAFEMDERKLTRMVTVRTERTSDDNNHDVVHEGTVHMKVSSDTESVGFYYSINGQDWQLVRVFRNDFPKNLWLGISSQSPMGEGINVSFEDCSLEQKAVKDFRTGI